MIGRRHRSEIAVAADPTPIRKPKIFEFSSTQLKQGLKLRIFRPSAFAQTERQTDRQTALFYRTHPSPSLSLNEFSVTFVGEHDEASSLPCAGSV